MCIELHCVNVFVFTGVRDKCGQLGIGTFHVLFFISVQMFGCVFKWNGYTRTHKHVHTT